MAVLEKPGSLRPFIPADQETKPEAQRITYDIRVPDYWDKIAYDRRLAQRGAKKHSLMDLHARVRHVMRTAFPEGLPNSLQDIDAAMTEREEFLRATAAFVDANAPAPDAAPDAIEAYQAALMEKGKVIVQQASGLGPYYDQIAALDTRFRDMIFENLHHDSIRAGVAVEMFVSGWSNLSVPLQRGADGLTASCLGALHAARPQDFIPLCNFIDGLIKPTEAEAGNSVSPSTGNADTSSSEPVATA